MLIYEPTGSYSAFLEEFCAREKLHVVRLNPRKVPYLLEVLGHRAKTDRLDAKALHAYGKIVDPSEIQICKLDERKEKLVFLLSDYFFLRQQETAFANHLEALERNPFSSSRSKDFVRKQLQSIKGQIKALRKEMEEVSREDEEIEGSVEKMKEIAGVGFLTALGLSLLFERRQVWRRQEVVALLGLDPMVRQSGKTEGARRISRKGDQRLRALLYMAALCALRVNGKIREFYQRLRKRGKPGKVAVVACMRKLALLCWAHYKIAHASSTP